MNTCPHVCMHTYTQSFMECMWYTATVPPSIFGSESEPLHWPHRVRQDHRTDVEDVTTSQSSNIEGEGAIISARTEMRSEMDMLELINHATH